MLFSFDEGDTTEDAATLATKLIPDLPDVSSMSFLSNGKGSGPEDAASFAADFAEAAPARASALSHVCLRQALLTMSKPNDVKLNYVVFHRLTSFVEHTCRPCRPFPAIGKDQNAGSKGEHCCVIEKGSTIARPSRQCSSWFSSIKGQ